MESISFITGNKGKFAEIQSFLAEKEIHLSQLEIDLEEVQEVDPEKVIAHKVQEALKKGHTQFILEDTSLYFEGMGSLPGPLIKWFLQELTTEGLFRLASKQGIERARAETILAYVKTENKIYYYRGVTEGKIVAPRGTKDFGWGPIFQPEESLKTFAEMEYSEKHSYSMRIRALEQLRAAMASPERV